MGAEEAFRRALAGDEGAVIRIAIGRQQVGRIGVGTGDHQRRHAEHVGGQASGDQLLDRFLCRHQYFAAHMTAFLHRRQLVFEVHPGGAGGDHRFHQLEGVQHAAEAGFRIGDNRQEVIGVAFAARLNLVRPLDLIGAAEGVVDALDHLRHRVHRIQRLVRVHGRRAVGVGRHLPAGQVDSLDAGFSLLQRLATGQRAQAVHVAFARLAVQQRPQFGGAVLRQGAFWVDRTAQVDHVFGAVRAGDAFPTGRFPFLFQLLDLLRARGRHNFYPFSHVGLIGKVQASSS